MQTEWKLNSHWKICFITWFFCKLSVFTMTRVSQTESANFKPFSFQNILSRKEYVVNVLWRNSIVVNLLTNDNVRLFRRRDLEPKRKPWSLIRRPWHFIIRWKALVTKPLRQNEDWHSLILTRLRPESPLIAYCWQNFRNNLLMTLTEVSRCWHKFSPVTYQ